MSLPRSLVVIALASALCGTSAAQDAQPLEGWGRTVDPDGDCTFSVDGEALMVTAPGPAHDLSAELGRMNAPRVLREVDGDFIAEVRVDGVFEPGEAGLVVRTAYNGAGLVVMANDDTYLRLERATLVGGGRRRPYANFELRTGGRIVRFGNVADFALEEGRPTWLRIERRGGMITGAVAQEEGVWHAMEPKRVELPDRLSIGVAAVNASTLPFSPRFEKMAVFVKQAPPAEVDPEPSP